MNEKYGSRKFFLACVTLTATIVGLFTQIITEQSFIVLIGGILGLYGYQNIKDKGSSS